MPRKGFEKLRTGCITCKARKVKCDEGRPECLRCQTSGRICKGYRKPPLGSRSWSSLLEIRPSTIPFSESSSAEFRSLDFFRCTVAPALTSPLGKSFWTHPVCQLAVQEPATRHAVVAISLLYERFGSFTHEPFSDNQDLAVRHYNTAMRHIATSKDLKTDATLLISILFICIEFLRGDHCSAVEHCRHSLYILESMGHPPLETSAIINHLKIFPFFFGATLSDFPLLQSLKFPNKSFNNIPEAIETMDCLMSRCVGVLRAFDPFRMGIVDMEEIPTSLLAMQQELDRELDIWHTDFARFEQNTEQTNEDRSHLHVLEVRWHVCKIWLRISSHRDEIFVDTFRGQFERILDLAREYSIQGRGLEVERPSYFKFEMGLAPLLHFVVMKCRYLDLRLEAWSLLRTVGHAQESLWNTNVLYAAGKCIIEREHGIDLPLTSVKSWLGNARLDYTLPSDSMRIRDSYIEDEKESYLQDDGSRSTRRRIFFFMPHDALGSLRRVQDWIYLPEKEAVFKISGTELL